MTKIIVRWALNVIAAAGVAVTLVVGVWPFFGDPNIPAQVLATILITVVYLILMYAVRAPRAQIEHVSLERGTAKFAQYYANFYRLEGNIYIFCEDTEWLEGDVMRPVVEAIAGKGKKATVCLSDTSYPTTEELSKREVDIVSIPANQALEVKMSYRVNGTEKILIIRGAADGTTRRTRRHPIEVNTFTRTTNADLVNLAGTIFSTILETRSAAPATK
ncbi:hypothetical protein AB0O65_08130 [Microbacterium sp. NPDC077391]|uniref:hypothetical protein n=1 Tax=Microbacterium sp. NPDC077391 TaxID=3154765 RepID=UPI003413D3BA